MVRIATFTTTGTNRCISSNAEDFCRPVATNKEGNMDLEWGDTSRSSMEEEIPKEMFEENYDDENVVLQEEANFFDAWQQPRHSNAWHFRCIQPCDRQRIQELHEEWFPVRYQHEFYDDLVHGKMCHTGEDLYSNLAIQDHHIAACIVAAIVPAKRLNQASRQLLLPDPHHHQSACYIMTLGTVTQYRNAGLATRLVEKCIHDLVLSDRSCGALYLHVITSNHSAIRFYERLGFWRVQEIQDYYTIDNQYHNCYLYAKYFNGKRSSRE